MQKANAWLVLITGILLILNVVGTIDVLSGTWGWILAIVVTLIGIVQLMSNYKKGK